MMLTAWLLCGAGLTLGALMCGLAAASRDTLEALVALQLAGTLTTVALVCLTVGFQQSSYGDLPVAAAVLNWIGNLVYLRFLDRSRA
jgi:multisubunit Na+/H+ antiporter MnhF subunit